MSAAGLHAQVVRYDNIALGPQGGPVSGATVAVCAATADTSTTPCSPLVQLYSDEAMTQPLANPFPADSLGNYGFWAAPGHYIVQIYGSTLRTRQMDVFLPCDPANCTMSSATFSSITANTLNLSGSLTVNGRGVATKALPNDAVQYVSPNGNDANDGLSWGTAKQTVTGAWNALLANTNPGGTIYVAAGAACGSAGANHLWISGAASPPAGWLKVGPIRVAGVGATSWAFNGHVPLVNLSCGSASDPPLWIANTSTPMEFDHLGFFSGPQAVRLGITSTGARTGGGVSTITFKGDGFEPDSSVAGNGPAVDIGGSSFWIYFDDCEFLANSNTGKTAGSDAAMTMVINPTPAGNSSGLIFISHSNESGGEIKYYCGATECGNLNINGLQSENQTDGHGAVWITSAPADSQFNIQNVGVSDATTSTPAVEVDGGLPGATVVANVAGQNVNTQGPMTVLGGDYPNSWQNTTQEPTTSQQMGFMYGHVWGQTDAGRRMFPPVAVRMANLASEYPNWSVSNYGLVGTTSSIVTGPDGASYALEATSPSDAGGTQDMNVINGTVSSYSAGDRIVVGVWWRSVSGNGPAGGYAVNMGLTGGCAVTNLDGSSYGNAFGQMIKGDGEWQWFSHAVKVTSGGSCGLTVGTHFTNANGPVEISGPVVLHITDTSVSENEVAEIAANLASYPDGVPSLSEATLLGHPFSFGGSGDRYFGTLDHTALTGNHTYLFPDADGTVCLTTTCSNSVNVNGAAVSNPNFNSTTPAAGANLLNLPLVVSGSNVVVQPSISGNSAKLATATGSFTSGHCAQWDASGNVIDSGGPCAAGVSTASANTWTATQTFSPAAGSVPVVVKMPASPTTDAFQVQNSTGTVLGTFDSSGNVHTYNQLSAATNQNLSINPGCGSCAVYVNGPGILLGSTSSHIGNSAGANGDLAGQIAISAATSGSHTFSSAYSNAPVCTVSPTSAPGTTTWWVTTTTTAVTVNLSASGTITFNYICIGNPN
jgi:hypothetical protein